jgi:hypothetical protein
MINTQLLRASMAALLFSFSVVGVLAQSPTTSPTPGVPLEKQILIKELLELTSPQATVDAMLKAQADQMEHELPDLIWQAVSGMKELQSLTPQQREEVRLQVVPSAVRSGRRMYELIQEKIDFKQVIEEISIPLYDKYFSESELRDFLLFYKSPTGKKVIETMPNLVTEAMTRANEIIVPKMGELLSQIQAEETQHATKEILASVKAKSIKPAAKTPHKRRGN